MRTRWFFVLVSLVILSLALANCRQSSELTAADAGYVLQLDVAPEPASVGTATLQLTLLQEDGSPVDNAQISVKGDMSHAGMAPVLGSAESGPDGIYTVPFEWTMAGDWIVTVDVTLADGTTFSDRFDLAVDGG
jgi:hypothetical protein